MNISPKELAKSFAGVGVLFASVLAACILKGWGKGIAIAFAVLSALWILSICIRHVPAKKRGKASRAPRREAEPFPTEDEVIVYELLDDDD